MQVCKAVVQLCKAVVKRCKTAVRKGKAVMSWGKKKAEFFKIQDETFKYNLQEGIWKKDMIRITYQQKADFILKRIKALLKRLKE